MASRKKTASILDAIEQALPEEEKGRDLTWAEKLELAKPLAIIGKKRKLVRFDPQTPIGLVAHEVIVKDALGVVDS